MITNNIKSKGIYAAMIAIAIFVGAAGVSVIKTQGGASAATTTAANPTPAVNSANDPETNDGKTAAAGTFKPNEDSAHEANESTAREAQEDAGARPTVK